MTQKIQMNLIVLNNVKENVKVLERVYLNVL